MTKRLWRSIQGAQDEFRPKDDGVGVTRNLRFSNNKTGWLEVG